MRKYLLVVNFDETTYISADLRLIGDPQSYPLDVSQFSEFVIQDDSYVLSLDVNSMFDYFPTVAMIHFNMPSDFVHVHNTMNRTIIDPSLFMASGSKDDFLDFFVMHNLNSVQDHPDSYLEVIDSLNSLSSTVDSLSLRLDTNNFNVVYDQMLTKAIELQNTIHDVKNTFDAVGSAYFSSLNLKIESLNIDTGRVL